MKTAPLSQRGAGRAPPTTTLEPLFVDGSDREFRRFIYRLLTMSARIDRLRERIGKLIGLNGFQCHIVMIVAELDGVEPVSVAAVAEMLHTSGAYVTMETGKLQRAGLIEKRPNPDDRRGVLLSLTGEGRRRIEAMSGHLRAINDVLFADFGSEDFEAFNGLVARMLWTTPAALAAAERSAAAAGRERA